MSDNAKAKMWMSLFILVIFTPLLILFFGSRPSGREFWRELSVALGFAGMALMGFQFIPTARFPFLAKIFPMDTLHAFHHRISIAGFCLALIHPLLLFAGNPYTLRLLDITSAPWRARAAVIGILLFLLLIASSVWRKNFKIPYESWRKLHDFFAIFATGLIFVHMFMVNHYMANPIQRGYWIMMLAVGAGATLFIRVFRPIQLLRRPYEVIEVLPERGDSWTLAVKPDGHRGLNFLAGQFAWIFIRKTPFSFRANPFSFSSSAETPERIEFTIKNLGDLTAKIPDLKSGERVYLDGPFGNFDIDQYDAPGYVMIAGGIGSVPVISILRTMADRQDTRKVLFFYGNPDWESITHRDELERLKSRMNLELVYVLDSPAADWEGEAGFINSDVMDKYLPKDHEEFLYFICGPIPMINAVEKDLVRLGVSLKNIHTENYEMA